MPHTKHISRSWSPPHCPNPNCMHHNDPGENWRYKRIGTFRRLQAPTRIQRFTCKACKRSFSTQTFSTTYWQKRPDLDRDIFMKTVGCMANRQVARDLRVSPDSIDRHLSRHELRVALTALFKRFPNLARTTDELSYDPISPGRRLVSLRVTW